MVRMFVTFQEAAEALGTDYEGLRQGFETGLARHLPAYVYCGDRPFLAALTGCAVVNTEHGSKLTLADGRVIGAGFPWELEHGELDASELGDSCCDVEECFVDEITEKAPAFQLHGFFRVAAYEMKQAAREHNLRRGHVAPASWWLDGSPMPQRDSGGPFHLFTLMPSPDSRFKDLPDLSSLWFKIDDLTAISEAKKPDSPPPQGETTKPPRLRSDREQNLLRVIAAMWALSDLPKEQTTAADKLSALMDGWLWDKPAAGTIADTILKEAANLPGARIRS